MKRIQSSSVKKHDDFSNLPIIAAIYELTKGEFLNEKKEDEQKCFKQTIYAHRK